MNLATTFFFAFILCVVLSFASMFLVLFFGDDVFNAQIFVFTVFFATAVLRYVDCAKTKK